MELFLTGIQVTSEQPHLGNILGALQPTLAAADKHCKPVFLFIANLHTLTSQVAPERIEKNTQAVVATLLALGMEPKKHCCYLQSALPEVCELTWYLNCLTSYSWLKQSHAFKHKAELYVPNAGLFTYPVLMAADILLLGATHIPVGKDQLQHLEITNKLVRKFNNQYGATFSEVQPVLQQEQVIPGIDGRKMSKSYNNYFSPLDSIEKIHEAIMQIPTDSLPLAAPKNPSSCHVFQLYQAVATKKEVEAMRQRYLAGGMGYKKAKEALIEKIKQTYAKERALYQQYKEDVTIINTTLRSGQEAARPLALATLEQVRKKLRFS